MLTAHMRVLLLVATGTGNSTCYFINFDSGEGYVIGHVCFLGRLCTVILLNLDQLNLTQLPILGMRNVWVSYRSVVQGLSRITMLGVIVEYVHSNE